MDEKGITMMRLQRLHLSSSPSPRTLAMSWPHSQRVSPEGEAAVSARWVVGIIDQHKWLIEIENDY